MGGEPWFYVVPYQPDLAKVLSDLKQREFQAGRYNPAQPSPFLPAAAAVAPASRRHVNIEAAIRAAGPSGTRSILDMNRIAMDPDDLGYGVLTPVSDESLEERFGTTHPTREMVEEVSEFAGDVDRGHGAYVILYDEGQPAEILFAGCSYD